jgi:hypothetical protein
VIDAGRQILKSNDGVLVPGLSGGLAGMPALSACRIVVVSGAAGVDTPGYQGADC